MRTICSCSVYTGETRFLEEARAERRLEGRGFLLAYETHITAQAAAACSLGN